MSVSLGNILMSGCIYYFRVIKTTHMKYSLLLCAMSLMLACNRPGKVANSVEYINLTNITGGYFLRNDVVLEGYLSCMVATSQEMLDANFGYGAVMGEQHTAPNFEQVYVLAIVQHAKDRVLELSFGKAELVGGDLKVACMVKETGIEQSYESTPVALATVKRDASIKTVSFYNGDNLIRKVEL